MADEASSSPGPFDVRTVRFLVALMSRHDLSEIDLSQGDQRIRLRRGSHVPVAAPAPAAAHAAAPPPLPAAAAPPPLPTAPARKLLEIKSPGPGTFYASEKPDLPPCVTVGSRVNPSTVVGIFEAMKVFNEITADCTGVIAEVLVENGQPVEYNQVLFRVDPS